MRTIPSAALPIGSVEYWDLPFDLKCVVDATRALKEACEALDSAEHEARKLGDAHRRHLSCVNTDTWRAYVALEAVAGPLLAVWRASRDN